MDDGHIAKRLRIRGHVQGVGYRAWAAAAARGLDGWVRNRADGSVEALVSGEAATVDAFVAACRRGPPGARVDAIEVEPALGIVARGFAQKPTV